MSLFKRKDSENFWCRFTIRGREIRQSTGTPKRQEAEEFETNLRSSYWRQIQLGESFVTFADAGKQWLAETDKKTSGKDAQMIDWWNYERNDAGDIVGNRLADVALREISREVLIAARTKLVETLSKATVNHYLGIVRSIMRKARDEWGTLENVPKFPMFKLDRQDPRWLTRAQCLKLISELPAHAADLAGFAVATGLRKSNITGLTWDRVDLKRKTAYIDSTSTKAKRGIPIALNADALNILRRRKGIHKIYVFTYQGEPIRDVVTKAWRAACKRAGVEGFKFHELRHTWASWQVQAETPLSALKEMGSWASYDMVQRYAHLSPGHLRQYADRTLLGTGTKGKGRKRA